MNTVRVREGIGIGSDGDALCLALAGTFSILDSMRVWLQARWHAYTVRQKCRRRACVGGVRDRNTNLSSECESGCTGEAIGT